MKEYKTVRLESNNEFIEKKSRFIGYVKPVETQQQAVEFIYEIKSKHWDATHNVSAYILPLPSHFWTIYSRPPPAPAGYGE